MSARQANQAQSASSASSPPLTRTPATSQAFNPNLDLPAFEFGLPTILPPGSTANLIFDLTLEEIGFEVDLDINLRAEGTLVPEPASLSALGLGLAALCRRRRTK
jgi:hypothetical protein